MELDEVDYKILKILESDSNTNLTEIGKRVGIFSASAISRRIKNMKKDGIIERYTIDLNPEKLGINFITITFVRAKYSDDYMRSVANQIKEIDGVISVYFLLGDIDFVLLTRSKSKEDYENILSKLTKIVEIERTDSRTVLKVFKEHDYSSVLELLRSKQLHS
ncbi:MAG: Lrp/AsnC family transcriptional regulator [Thermoplasmataceae archaeon]